MNQQAKSLRRLAITALALIGMQFALAQVLSHARLLEHLLAPGIGSEFALLVTALFLLLRVVVFVLLPGWIAAHAFLTITHRPSARAQSADRR